MSEDDPTFTSVPPDDAALKRLKQKALGALRAEGKEVVELRTGLPPLSGRVCEIARLWLENAGDDREIQRHIFTLAVAAWNASSKPRGSRGDDFDAALRSLGARGLQRVLSGGAIEAMIGYKEALFPDDPRSIVAWEIVGEDDAIRLNVVSGRRL